MFQALNTALVAGLIVPGAALFTFVAYRLLVAETTTETTRAAVVTTTAIALLGLFFGGSPLIALVASLTAGATVFALLTGADAKVIRLLGNQLDQLG